MNPDKTNPEKKLTRWLLLVTITLLAAVLTLQLWLIFGGEKRSQAQDANPQNALSQDEISSGKAAMIQDVQSLNAALSYDALAALSVEELEQLWKTGAPGMPIGVSAASSAAEEYAGTTAMDSVTWDVDPKLDESPAHYEVELHHVTGNYKYKVDAYTGQVLEGRPAIFQNIPPADGTLETSDRVSGTEPDTDPELPDGASSSEDIAIAAALAHAGVREADAEDLTIGPDWDGNILVYEIKFRFGGMEYEYRIEASSGAVRKAVQEWGPTFQRNEYISGAAARQAALDHAGVRADGLVTWKLDEEDGRGVYVVEFRSGNVKYKYVIDAADGAVLKSTQES